MLKLTSLKTEIARSVRGPKLQEPCAEDALGEPYLVQKILVIWFQQITKFTVKVVNLGTIIDISRGAGLGHPMNQVVSVQNKNFSGITEELAKVLGAKQEA